MTWLTGWRENGFILPSNKLILRGNLTPQGQFIIGFFPLIIDTNIIFHEKREGGSKSKLLILFCQLRGKSFFIKGAICCYDISSMSNPHFLRKPKVNKYPRENIWKD